MCGGGGGWGGGGGLHPGLAALVGRNESLEAVYSVGVNCGVVETVPVHRRSHKERIFVLLCVTVLDVKASVVISCVGNTLLTLLTVSLQNLKSNMYQVRLTEKLSSPAQASGDGCWSWDRNTEHLCRPGWSKKR